MKKLNCKLYVRLLQSKIVRFNALGFKGGTYTPVRVFIKNAAENDIIVAV